MEKLDIEAIERALVNERDPELEAWLRGDRASDKGLTIIVTGFDKLTPTEHAQQQVRRQVKRANMQGANAPKIPSENRAKMPANCRFEGCETMLWFSPGQGKPFCADHDTPEIREEYGW